MFSVGISGPLYRWALASMSSPSRLTRLFTSTTSLLRPILGPEGARPTGRKALTVKPCLILGMSLSPEYVGASHLKLRNVVWRNPLQNIYVVKKPWNEVVRNAMITFINFVNTEYPAVNVIVSEDVADELTKVYESSAAPSTKHTVYTGPVADIVAKADLIVLIGGDGTTLRAVSAFLNGKVPPVLCFAMGTVGFLLPFDFATFRDTFRAVFQSRSKAFYRTRLECHVVREDEANRKSESYKKEMAEIAEYELAHYKQHHDSIMMYAMNDVSLHRGLHPNLIKLDIFVDSEFLTSTTGDGLIFATPTGSTAYSLSLGGPIVHPLVPSILVTPICPQSLSFRPLVLPATSHVMVQLLDQNSLEAVKLTIDGIPQMDMRPGDKIHIVNENGTIYIPGTHQPPRALRKRRGFDDIIEPGSMPEQNGIYCIAKGENDWVLGINELLGFNSSFKGRPR